MGRHEQPSSLAFTGELQVLLSGELPQPADQPIYLGRHADAIPRIDPRIAAHEVTPVYADVAYNQVTNAAGGIMGILDRELRSQQ